MGNLYETDILEWSERQAALLRRVAAGEAVNEAVDWANLIEEVEAVGRSELRACESLLRQALIHLLNLRAWPDSKAAAHWRAEVREFCLDAGDAFTPSMRQRIDLARLYGRALNRVRTDDDDYGAPQVLPDICPFTLDELLSGDLP